MNTFTVGQKVRITPKFAEGHEYSDGSYDAKVGVEGIVRIATHEGSDFALVDLPGEDFPWLFLPEELEAV